MSKKKWLTAGIAMLSVMTLAACSNNKSSESGAGKHVSMSATYSGPGKATTAGNNSTLKVAEVNDAPFAGITAPTLASNAEDQDVFAPGGEGNLFNVGKDYKIIDGGLANQKISRSAKTITITLRKDAKWSNGAKVTAKDVEYPYEIIGNKNTTSQQYSADYAEIKGMAAYHAGKAKTISGITFPDGQNGRTAVIHYSHMSPSMKYAGNSFVWTTVEPYEYYKGIPIAKLASSSKVRKNPIFVGPYKLDKVVQGESTSWSPNKYYYGKAPKVKHITIQVVSTNNALAAFKSKKYDFAAGGANSVMPSSQYPKFKKLSDYGIAGTPSMGYGYFGFNVGHMDTKTGLNVMDKNSKMANKSLRRAMMYAANVNAVEKKFGNGVSWQANTLIPPAFKDVYDAKNPGFKYNMKKAKSLLDKAGYKKDGKWRTDPNGKKLVIHFGGMQSSAATEAEYQFYLQQWHKLGLNVKMTGGKPMEMNSFYATLQKPKQTSIDVFLAAWSLSTEPTPTQIYGVDAPFNMGHFATKKNTALMKSLNNNKAWNAKYRAQQYKKWQRYMNSQAAYVAEDFSMAWSPVNKRVKGYSVAPTNNEFWSNLSLTAANPK
ncbi:oligopeptide ABC transporter substrate-binding protein [Lentilactobacillus otakiensis]|uniref:ABC transporter periplasmic protein n=1 Tax=Lentilactobacillus otakiensis DSM 19908 = JCM 15040 TaxID=1423780 RepID=S4NNB5_9LACO|nr:oligopeptide ABC transporter substrate-binding protein [Lentilactobacillus otakiensis]KRL10996.1 ABC transporter periplasmic protein [Lentilactobacillus otakiensis DSM 19908 = JCM 15040]MBZ3777230.1 oligopeptide ABC transporter substrate-binding protein [Lentilactobacillus otakiensis]MDV3517826.1 oligopeptide ABC transporter substrate-binding protein [Lentilactobacillus otakiensis]GAD17336.1 ABC transporter periplasmic protein [Lentilactobacillus otakiensis DSM 19908 = JCM 15040]